MHIYEVIKHVCDIVRYCIAIRMVVALRKQLMVFKVPCYVVRNKVDQDAFNNLQDHGACVEETLAEIRLELLDYHCDPQRIFLLSAKQPDFQDFDFKALLHTMAEDVRLSVEIYSYSYRLYCVSHMLYNKNE